MRPQSQQLERPFLQGGQFAHRGPFVSRYALELEFRSRRRSQTCQQVRKAMQRQLPVRGSPCAVLAPRLLTGPDRPHRIAVRRLRMLYGEEQECQAPPHVPFQLASQHEDQQVGVHPPLPPVKDRPHAQQGGLQRPERTPHLRQALVGSHHPRKLGLTVAPRNKTP